MEWKLLVKLYEGKREGGAPYVTVDGHPIDVCTDIKNHSPSGLEWGYIGSGCAQTALAIVSDHLEVKIAACTCCYSKRAKLYEIRHEVECKLGGRLEILFRTYQRFKELFVARFEEKGWALREEEVRLCILELENEHKAREKLRGQ